MMDKIGTSDHVAATLDTEATTPEHPCPECGKAMKDANTQTTKRVRLDVRICSNKNCRWKADWSTGEPTSFTEPEPTEDEKPRW
jgi:predicted RNA-binding Zn-ribbon protein involved in translation (DUF1610 family)